MESIKRRSIEPLLGWKTAWTDYHQDAAISRANQANLHTHDQRIALGTPLV